MKIDDLFGKCFCAENGDWYGDIRELGDGLPAGFNSKNDIGGTPIAADDGGNLFVLVGRRVCFWDHETEEIFELSPTFEEFAENCGVAPEVDMSEVTVESVWIEPGFAEEMGIEVPEDGWIKKP